ncbi:hypothetical protein CIP101841_00940 [Corynebacterium diphtheriae]|nr:hypothetical protein CIP101841_00940 [Corynebacterium diphtheriae]
MKGLSLGAVMIGVTLLVVLNVSQKVTGFWQETDRSVQGGVFRVVATHKTNAVKEIKAMPAAMQTSYYLEPLDPYSENSWGYIPESSSRPCAGLTGSSQTYRSSRSLPQSVNSIRHRT